MHTPAMELKINLIDFALCFSRALDLLHPQIVDHHLRVSYIASSLAEECGFSPEETKDVLIAGALHDLAAVSSPAMVPVLNHALSNYDLSDAASLGDVHQHGEEAYRLLREFKPFAAAASYIRFHHVSWDYGRGVEWNGQSVHLASHIINLADRIAVLPRPGSSILTQVDRILEMIRQNKDRLFNPQFVEAFEKLAARESFWLDLEYLHKESIICDRFGLWGVEIGIDMLEELGRTFGRIIDYRSPFTATHSTGVAATAEVLGQHLGMSLEETKLLKIAGYLHDIGK